MENFLVVVQFEDLVKHSDERISRKGAGGAKKDMLAFLCATSAFARDSFVSYRLPEFRMRSRARKILKASRYKSIAPAMYSLVG